VLRLVREAGTKLLQDYNSLKDAYISGLIAHGHARQTKQPNLATAFHVEHSVDPSYPRADLIWLSDRD
jgi:O-acetyl-ADP-ribose deacetylase (regulator of RNase III)